jgi:hypothetical protein
MLIARNGAVTDHFNAYESHVYQYKLKIGVGTGDAEPAEPRGEIALEAYPNPSSGRTAVRFDLPAESSMLINVYDAGGRRVATAGRGTWAAGRGEVVWSGRDDHGRPVAPGVYFVRASTSDGRSASARVMIAR